MTETVVNEPKVVSQPKVWSDAPIIEEYELDSEDEHVSLPTEEQETPSFTNKQVKTPRETIKNQFTHSKNPKVNKKGLGYGFVTKACFVCGSLSPLISDCDFHEKRMAKQAELNNRMRKKSSQMEIRPIWNNVQRVNHKNQYVPTAAWSLYWSWMAAETPRVFRAIGKGPTWLFDLDYLTDSMNYQPVRSENQANKHAGPQEANQNAVKSSKAGEEPTKHPDFQQVDKEDQVFLDELERLKRQEQDANDAAEALRKDTPVSTAKIPALEEIYANPTNGIFTNSSYDDEGAVADFTNLEPVVNVSPIPTSRINSIHPSTLILGDPQSAVQTRSKVTKRRTAAIQDSESLDSCRFALWEEGNWNKIGFIDPKCPKKVYKVVKALYGLHQAPRAWYATLSTFLLKNGYRRGTIGKTLFIKNDKSNIMLVEVYVDDIIFGSTKKSWCDEIKTASRPIETQKPLVKDEEASDVDVHLYRSMIGSLMYLTASRADIMFAVCVFLDSDYARANLDRKSTTGGCQFLGRRLISWQCKKQTIVAASTTEAEYVAAANCYGQNPVYHSKTKHIAIRHHFIRDAYEKKLIQVLKIHTDDNVADLLTKAFDVSSYLGFRESLGRALDGTEALLLPKLFILWLAKVSTDSANLVPLGKDSTAIETLKKIPPRV
ncbi:putative ribonuclease H-like domain-containing protein [Tanacetum coccineum]